MRLDKYLCETGAGTRSEVKKMIAKGRVSVNGSTEKDPGRKIAEGEDLIEADGRVLSYAAFEYFMLNKPQGVISASKADLRNRKERCVVDLITERMRNDLFPVGRLDKDTEGLLLITNDGALAHRLLSPRKHVEKLYYAETDGVLSGVQKKQMEQGVDIGDGKPTLPCRLWEAELQSDSAETSGTAAYYIAVCEGRFHQIKRMFAAFGREVVFLKRLRMGSLSLDEGLKPGEYRRLSDAEVKALDNP